MESFLAYAFVEGNSLKYESNEAVLLNAVRISYDPADDFAPKPSPVEKVVKTSVTWFARVNAAGKIQLLGEQSFGGMGPFHDGPTSSGAEWTGDGSPVNRVQSVLDANRYGIAYFECAETP